MELREEKKKKQTKNRNKPKQTYGTYYQGIFLAEYSILKASRVQQGGGLAGVYTGLRQTTIRNFFQDKSSHIWTVTNAFQVKIRNGGW